jgi:hypothetical protein
MSVPGIALTKSIGPALLEMQINLWNVVKIDICVRLRIKNAEERAEHGIHKSSN